MHYLTVQDMLWLNLQLTGSEQEFDFAELEEATFLQYAYHGSKDLTKQAARFLTGFKKKEPFTTGNDACAFIGAVAFLEANGQSFELVDEKGNEWLEGVWSDPSVAQDAIKAKLSEGHVHTKHGVPNFHEICEEVIDRYSATLSSLAVETVEA